jgi:hypothetical protein
MTTFSRADLPDMTGRSVIVTGANTRALLPERERVRLRAGFEERDLHGPLSDCIVRAHELVQAAVLEAATPVPVDVHAV